MLGEFLISPKGWFPYNRNCRLTADTRLTVKLALISVNGNRLAGVTGSAVTAAGNVQLCSVFAGSCSCLTAQLALRYLMETLVSSRGGNSIALIMSHDAVKPIKLALFSGKTTPISKWRLS